MMIIKNSTGTFPSTVTVIQKEQFRMTRLTIVKDFYTEEGDLMYLN